MSFSAKDLLTVALRRPDDSYPLAEKIFIYRRGLGRRCRLVQEREGGWRHAEDAGDALRRARARLPGRRLVRAQRARRQDRLPRDRLRRHAILHPIRPHPHSSVRLRRSGPHPPTASLLAITAPASLFSGLSLFLIATQQSPTHHDACHHLLPRPAALKCPLVRRPQGPSGRSRRTWW